LDGGTDQKLHFKQVDAEAPILSDHRSRAQRDSFDWDGVAGRRKFSPERKRPALRRKTQESSPESGDVSPVS